ncbi:small acid-soluble spore protein Tlp [Aquisalibacillus elongatus]|uniref:Small, acid-soluble spore protein Tlp n=1 Tax=Aquisalibacillus elongatus TaxID=485577 RepID=A0A3N5BDW8_9BACI|nr:small acid-soluble spore protein Tlp [Aquisalibacillus elongatus]RPF55886.1 small acid-soluble spore protein (thioredoxin-like protein) [Aquisalibacillus elongatus]
MANHKQPKPDDRSDNVEKIQDNIQNTIENMEEAEESMETASDEQKQAIEAKNERRRQSIKGLKEEASDEAHDH